jgi:transcriptional regulator, marR family protein
MGDGDKILNSASVRLGILGVQVTELARQRLEPLGLTPKQVGLMAFVDSRTKASQREIASGMRVAPSLVVTLVDQLEALKAVTRIRRPGDRRVQEISLTEVGRKLLSEALVVVRALDENLTAHLADGDRRALDRTLEAVENGRWLPDSMGRGSAD